MTTQEIEELVRDCLRYAKAMALPRPLPTQPADMNDWLKLGAREPEIDESAEDAWFEVYRLVHDSPDEAWQVLTSLIAAAETEDELGSIGAGILESFVRNNGSAYAVEIESEVARSRHFITAMQMVNPVCITAHPDLDNRISHILGI